MNRVSTRRARRGWLIDIVAGVVVGGLVALVVAWNLAIFTGVEGGYQASLVDVFEHSPLVGTLVIVFLLSGPLVGVWVARRQRRKRDVWADSGRNPAD